MKTFRFFAGTHASAGQDSLCLCEADFQEAAFTELYTMREISDPTYLALSPDRILYTFGKTAAGVSVYAKRLSVPCPAQAEAPATSVSMSAVNFFWSQVTAAERSPSMT